MLGVKSYFQAEHGFAQDTRPKYALSSDEAITVQSHAVSPIQLTGLDLVGVVMGWYLVYTVVNLVASSLDRRVPRGTPV